MTFTVSQIVDDLLFVSIFLIVGYVLRELIPAFRKVYLSAAIIGGFVALILGQQVLGILAVPASLSSFVDPLTGLIFTCLCWGFLFTLDKVRSYLDFVCVNFVIGWAQIVGAALVALLCAGIWVSIPAGWSMMMPVGFMNGHSGIAIFGGIAEEAGNIGVIDIGMVIATIGLLVGIIFGTVFCNIGIRRGWAKYMRDAKTNRAKTAVGALPEDLRQPIGKTTVNTLAVNNLIFQFAIIGVVYIVGRLFVLLLNTLIPSLGMSYTIGGIFGAFIVWPILVKTKLDKFVDKQTVQTIAGALVDIILVAAMATLNLQVISMYWVPILILCAVGTVITAVFAYGGCYMCCKEDWFEKGSYLYGLGTGVAATGMALLRIIDPNNESSVYEVRGIGSAIILPLNMLIWPTMTMMMMNSPSRTFLIAGAVVIATVVFALIVFHGTPAKRKASGY